MLKVNETLFLTNELIETIAKESAILLKEMIGDDLVKVILYGSCARGDYTEDSDIDIAVLLKGDRDSIKKYRDIFTKVSSELSIKYIQVINFADLPYKEFEERKSVYSYFKNIDKEGIIYYG